MIYAEGCSTEIEGSELGVMVEFQCICASLADAGVPLEHLHECVENGYDAYLEKQKRMKKDAKSLIKKVARNAQKNQRD